MAHGDSDTSGVSLVVFALHPERFALRGAEVREVVRSVAAAALPDAPDVVEGVITYRGARRHASVVYGMPLAAVEAGVVDVVLPVNADRRSWSTPGRSPPPTWTIRREGER